MSHVETTATRAPVEPLPDNLTSIQPGGGFCYRVELAWGRLRRWYLKTLRRGYVRRMAACREGDPAGCPHEVLDPRDLKYHRNQCTAEWCTTNDPFAWRDRLGLARWGLGELVIVGGPLLAMTVGLLAAGLWPGAIPPAVVLGWLLWFFRDPPRRVPNDASSIVAPCDGRVVEVAQLEHDEFIGGPAVRIGIFLSIFNVHINRMPAECRVVRLRYWPGKFISATNPASSWLNESLWIGLEEEAPPHRRFVVRQVAGLIARRIVCALRPGEVVLRGTRFGMIKLGSRTELILPADEVEVRTQPGDFIRGAETIVARWVERNAQE